MGVLNHVSSSATKGNLVCMGAMCASECWLAMPCDGSWTQLSLYAFLNFVSHEDAVLAMARLSGRSAGADASLEVSWSAEHQGFAVHVRRYRNSPVMHPSVPELYKPVIFKDGVQLPFPEPTKRIKEPRLRRGAPAERQ